MSEYSFSPVYSPVEMPPLAESGVELIRNQSVGCVGELEKPDNFDNFFAAQLELFRTMGLHLSSDDELNDRMRRLAKWRYDDGWHGLHAKHTGEAWMDMEVALESGTWVNMVAVGNTLPGGVRCVRLMPGACSRLEGDGKKPTNPAYKQMEEIFGVDWLVPGNNGVGFYVIGDRYFRLPENNVMRVVRRMLGIRK